MSCFSPLKGYRSRATGGITFKKNESAGEKMEVACGQCLGCRLDRSRMWAARILHEAQYWEEKGSSNCFITLTYDDEHLPNDGSLRKKDFQKFMKRLRKHFAPRKIRYYQVGEYGEELNRPHYHACLFNLDFSFDQELFSPNRGYPLFTSKTLQKLWPYGFSTIGDLTFESAAYCARYCTKKVTGKRADDHYLKVDIETGEAYWLQPEYATMSRRPGLARWWYDKYKKDVFPRDELPVPGQGVFRKVPTYYETILGSENEEELELVKERRRIFRDAHANEYSPGRLRQKFEVKRAQLNQLKRGYEND